MTVHKKLMQARMKLHSMALKKSGWNAFSKYHYWELADFLLPTLQIFNELGLCGTCSFNKELATLRITDLDDGTYIDFTSPMGGAELKAAHEIQQIGAVETYQRRYLYAAAMELVQHDGFDGLPPAKPNPYEDMELADDYDTLKKVYAAAYQEAKGLGNKSEMDKISAEYKRHKERMTQTPAVDAKA